MTIKRSARTTGFTVLNNAVFTGALSFRAMGLLAYLLSKPDHWEVSVQQLVNMSSETVRPDGRDSIYAIIDELIQSGFILRRLLRNSGKMNGYEYEVHDVPQISSKKPAPKTDSPDTAPPKTALPDTDLPDTAEPTQVKTDLEVNTEPQSMTESAEDKLPDCSRPKRQRKQVDPIVLPDCIPQASWDDWLAYRRQRRLSNVEATLKGQVKNLMTWAGRGHDVAAVIKASIDNGWQGLFEPKGAASKRSNSHSGFENRNYREGAQDDCTF